VLWQKDRTGVTLHFFLIDLSLAMERGGCELLFISS